MKRFLAALLGTLVLSGCFGPSVEDQALEAATERIEAIGIPDGYRLRTISTANIESDLYGDGTGEVELEWVTIDDGGGSHALIDDLLIGQGYRRYWDGVCRTDGGYSGWYAGPDMQLWVSMDTDADVVYLRHRFDSSLEAPTPQPIAANEVSELPECPNLLGS